MFRIAATLLVAGLTTMSPVSIRYPAPASRADLVGTWTGTFKSDRGPGEATLVITKKEGYAATFNIQVDHPVPMGDVTDLKVSEQSVSWSQHVMDTDCKGEAALDAGVLKGGLDCGTVSLTFELTKS